MGLSAIALSGLMQYVNVLCTMQYVRVLYAAFGLYASEPKGRSAIGGGVSGVRVGYVGRGLWVGCVGSGGEVLRGVWRWGWFCLLLSGKCRAVAT